MDGEGKVGTIVNGMDVVRQINSTYGDMPPWGNGPEQYKISALDRRSLMRSFPISMK